MHMLYHPFSTKEKGGGPRKTRAQHPRPISQSAYGACKIEAAGRKYAEALNQYDAAAIGDRYTQDAVEVWFGDGGLISAREAIVKALMAAKRIGCALVTKSGFGGDPAGSEPAFHRACPDKEASSERVDSEEKLGKRELALPSCAHAGVAASIVKVCEFASYYLLIIRC